MMNIHNYILLIILITPVLSDDCVNAKTNSDQQNCLSCVNKDTWGRNCYWRTTDKTCDHHFVSTSGVDLVDKTECLKLPEGDGLKADDIVDMKTGDLINMLSQMDVFDLIMSDKGVFRAFLKLMSDDTTLTGLEKRYWLKNVYKQVCPKTIKILSLATEISAASQITAVQDNIKDLIKSIALDSCNLVSSAVSIGSSTVGGAIAVGCAAATVAKDFASLAGAITALKDAWKFYALIKESMKISRTTDFNCKELITILTPDVPTVLQPDNSFALTLKSSIKTGDTKLADDLIKLLYDDSCVVFKATCTGSYKSLYKLRLIQSTQLFKAVTCPNFGFAGEVKRSLELAEAAGDDAAKLKLVTGDLKLLARVCSLDETVKGLTANDQVKCKTTKDAYCDMKSKITSDTFAVERSWGTFLQIRYAAKDCYVTDWSCPAPAPKGKKGGKGGRGGF